MTCLTASALLAACGAGEPSGGEENGEHDGGWDDGGPDGEDTGGEDNGPGDDGFGDCEFCNVPRPQAFTLDLSHAVGLAVVANGDQASGRRATLERGNWTIAPGVPGRAAQEPPAEDGGEGEGDGEGSLLEIDEDGNLEPAMEPTDPEGSEAYSDDELDSMWDPGPVPRVSAVGLAPEGNVYVLFEHSFLYRFVEPEDQDTDIWSPSSPYTCQLFRSKVPYNQTPTDPDVQNTLECVTNAHEIPQWGHDEVMQFDVTGKLYFPGMVPGTGKQVFYAYDPETSALTEKVNANICWHDVEVTPLGSIFYTGTSGSSDDCSGTSFFRYVSTDNRLIEIARGWWDFKYLAERDPEDPANERIIFYGPDPNSDEPGWETACVYRFDPSIADADARVTRLANCVNDVWGWIYGSDGGSWDTNDPTLDERQLTKERCESEGDVFIGGEGITDLDQTKDGHIYVAGNLKRKIAGLYMCSLEVGEDHCDSLDPAHGDQMACEDAGATWVQVQPHCSDPAYDNESDCWGNGGVWNFGGNRWYDEVTGNGCLVTDDPVAEDVDAGVYHRPQWSVQWHDCRDAEGDFAGGDSWVQNVAGFGHLETDEDAGAGNIVLLSDPEEEVQRFWVVEQPDQPMFLYASYDRGTYSLVRSSLMDGEVARQTLLNDYEVYSVNRDPNDLQRLLFDGLYFPTNTYMFGSMDPTLGTPEEVEASIELLEGLTGEIETLVILPEF